MLTLEEIESTMQIEYELRVEVLNEEELRELLADPTALRRLIPPHLSLAQGRSIAEATLTDVLTRKATKAGAKAKPEPESPWARWFDLFWMPLR